MQIVVPDLVKDGPRKVFGPFAFAWGYHSLQCDQRWYGMRIGRVRFAYRTRGDASPGIMTRKDAGIWWPWQLRRTCSGRKF